MKNFALNFFKLIGIMFISISLKNALQIFLGTLTNYSEVTKPYRLVNINNRITFDTKISHLKLIFLYDFILFASIAYFWLFLILYLLVKKFGNKLWIHFSYTILIYIFTITYFYPFNYNIIFIFITIILGYANWYLFKKWIDFSL